MATIMVEGKSLFMATYLSAPLLNQALHQAMTNVADQGSLLQDAIDVLQSSV